jgi:hypothetical protein
MNRQRQTVTAINRSKTHFIISDFSNIPTEISHANLQSMLLEKSPNRHHTTNDGS